jgi:hypothetical protein
VICRNCRNRDHDHCDQWRQVFNPVTHSWDTEHVPDACDCQHVKWAIRDRGDD